MFGRVACRGECDDETVHEAVGENQVGRPIWSCLECSTRRVGPFSAYVDTVDAAIATDGGKQ